MSMRKGVPLFAPLAPEKVHEQLEYFRSIGDADGITTCLAQLQSYGHQKQLERVDELVNAFETLVEVCWDVDEKKPMAPSEMVLARCRKAIKEYKRE